MAGGTGSPALVEEACRLTDLLDRRVILVLRRDEFRAAKNAEDGGIVNGQERRAHLSGEAGAEGRIHVAPDGPLVVREGRALPDHRNLSRIDLAGLRVQIP